MLILNCLAIFLLGWIAGLVCFVVMFHRIEQLQSVPLTKSFLKHIPQENDQSMTLVLQNPVTGQNNIQPVYVVPQPSSPQKSSTLQQQSNNNHDTTKIIKDSEQLLPNPDKSFNPWIYLDWPHDDRIFTAENYKSLESILNIYPESTIRVLLPAPNDAYVHKIGNSLSITHFTKYERRGYDLQVLPITMMKGKQPELGLTYKDKWLQICCKRCNGKCRNGDHIQPFHFYVYIRLVKLWRKGGITTDFTYLFLDNLQKNVQHGYTMSSHCDTEVPTMWQEEQERTAKGKWQLQRCFTSMTIVINREQSPLIECMLSNYDDKHFLQCIDNDKRLQGADCIRNAFDNCFDKLYMKNGLKDIVEDWNSNGILAKTNLIEPNNWKLKSETRLVWLGDKGTSAYWVKNPYPESSLIRSISDSLNLKKASWEISNSECQALCHTYSPSLELLKEFKITSYGTGIETASCAPTVVVPGFMKAASTFLFNAISAHPQVLPPLRGAQMKETYCYHGSPIRKLMKRPWCYPYIEPGENFVNSDGTVYYATNPDVPKSLKEDNPHVKVVFAVRHPVDRFYSNYKFSFDTYGKKGPIDDLIDIGTKIDDKFGILRNMTQNGATPEEVINYYYNGTFYGGGALGVLFMHSINYPAILHYRAVLGKENVMVIRSEMLNNRDMPTLRKTMNKVYDFLGLCPFELPDMAQTLIGKNKLPEEKELSKEGYNRLERFFQPFVEALGNLEGWDLNEWNQRKPKKSWGLNETYNGLRRKKIPAPDYF